MFSSEDLQFEVKGAAEYVEATTTVLLLERASQSRDGAGKFSQSAGDRILHFVKVKDAPTDTRQFTLQFDRVTLLFNPLMRTSE